MKTTKARLKQLIAEEIEAVAAEEEATYEPEYSEYELNDMDTDHQMVALLKEVVSQLKTLNHHMTPAKSLGASGAEKAMAGLAVAEAKKPKRPEFKSGQRVEHEEYGKGTVTHSGACPASGDYRKVSVKWDDPDQKAQCIEPNLKKI
jgi:hypothetical protein